MAINIPDPILSVLPYAYAPNAFMRLFDPYGIYSFICTEVEETTTLQKSTGTTILLPNQINRASNPIGYQSYSCTPIPIDFGAIAEAYK